MVYRASEAPAMFVTQQACSPFELKSLIYVLYTRQNSTDWWWPDVVIKEAFCDVVLRIAPLKSNVCPMSNSFAVYSPGQKSHLLCSLCDGIKPNVSSGSTYCIPSQLPMAV